MLTGRAYLRLTKDKRGKVTVAGVRNTKPDERSHPGTWVAVNLKVPESVFAAYETELEIPEKETESIITVLLPDELMLTDYLATP